MCYVISEHKMCWKIFFKDVDVEEIKVEDAACFWMDGICLYIFLLMFVYRPLDSNNQCMVHFDVDLYLVHSFYPISLYTWSHLHCWTSDDRWTWTVIWRLFCSMFFFRSVLFVFADKSWSCFMHDCR